MNSPSIIIDGRKESEILLSDLKRKILVLKTKYRITPGLAVFLVGDDQASRIYVRNKIRKAEELGFNISKFEFSENVSERVLKAKINSVNNDHKYNGLLVQLPLPKQFNKFDILNLIKPEKDVDGFTNYNIGMLHSGRESLQPCTPRGIISLIRKYFGANLSGKKAVVIGRSIIVGRPMAGLLLQEDCSVTILHSRSLDIVKECKDADILISAVGKQNVVTKDMVKEGACVIDVGIQRINDKLTGDVDFDEVKQVAGYITPVPGGVGPMTVACMLENTVIATCNQKDISYSELY